MFFATYITTLKTLRRSALFWIAFGVTLFIIMSACLRTNVWYAVVENDVIIKNVLDTDPDFVLPYANYIQTYVSCSASWQMHYAIPLFCVIVTIICLNRDYKDRFFEIQKTYGKKNYIHFFGQLAAMITVLVFTYLLFTYISFNTYYFTRGGLNGLTINEYFCDMIIRNFRVFITSALPTILFFTTVTYSICCILNDAVTGGILSTLLVLFVYLSRTILRIRLPDVYHVYLSPVAETSYRYWGTYNSNVFTTINPFTINQVLLWLCIIMGSVFFLIMICLLCSKHRTI